MLKIDSCFAGGFWLKNFNWRDFHDDLWSNFCQKGKVSTGKAESCFRKRKFHPLFCFGHLMLTQTDLIFWTARKPCNFSEMWRVHTTRYSVIFQKFPSRVRVVQKNPSSIRVAGTRWTLLITQHPHHLQMSLINCTYQSSFPHLISLITFDFLPLTNDKSMITHKWAIIHFQWTYHSPYFNYYPAPISRHSTPIIDYPLPIEYHKQSSTVNRRSSILTNHKPSSITQHSSNITYPQSPITHHQKLITNHS